jgi:chromosome segregation ATPase
MCDKDNKIEELEARIQVLTGDYRIERCERKRAMAALKIAEDKIDELKAELKKSERVEDLAVEMNRCREWLQGQVPKLLLCGKAVTNFAQRIKDAEDFKGTQYPWNPEPEVDYDDLQWYDNADFSGDDYGN